MIINLFYLPHIEQQLVPLTFAVGAILKVIDGVATIVDWQGAHKRIVISCFHLLVQFNRFVVITHTEDDEFVLLFQLQFLVCFKNHICYSNTTRLPRVSIAKTFLSILTSFVIFIKSFTILLLFFFDQKGFVAANSSNRFIEN